MRRLSVVIAIGTALAIGVAARAQQPKPMSADDYEAVMETIDPIFDNIRKNVEGKAKTDAIAADARKLPPLLKQAELFWLQRKRQDAVDFSRKAQEAALNLEKVAATGDAAKTTAAVKALGGACRNCHDEYREKLPDGSFRMKKLG